MMLIIQEIELETGERFLADNLRVGKPSNELHFDVLDSKGKWDSHRSFPIGDIFTIKTKILTIEL